MGLAHFTADEHFDLDAFCELNRDRFAGELILIHTETDGVYIDIPDTLNARDQDDAHLLLEQAFHYIM